MAKRHGYSKIPEYKVWRNMLTRCYRPTARSYHNYGGRGVFVCSRWRSDFAAFLEDLGPRPGPAYQLDRRDNDGSYTCGRCEECAARNHPANCRWSTPKENARNKRTNRQITFNGETHPIAVWSEITGIKQVTLGGRLNQPGADVADALTTPVVPNRRGTLLEFNGVRLTLTEWARRLGTKPHQLSKRLKRWNGDLARALSQPFRGRPGQRPLTVNGVTKTLAAWAAEAGLEVRDIEKRLDRGIDPGAAVALPARQTQSKIVWLEHDGVKLPLHGWAVRLGISDSSLRDRLKHCRGDLSRALRPAETRFQKGKP